MNDRVTERRTSSCSSRRTTSTRSSTSSWTVIEAKLGSSWSSREKSQWNGRIEAISGFYIRHNCEKKIGRRSRYYPWTHWQDTGIAKWSQLCERFERFSRCWISTQWTFPRCQSTCVLPTSSNSWWKDKPFYAESQNWAATHLEHMVYRETFFQIQQRLLQHLTRRNWIHGVLICRNQLIHSSPTAKNEDQTPVQDQRCQSGPSAKNSVIPSEGDSSKNYGADQQPLQISDLHFDKFPTPATFASRKIRFKTEVCTCSQFLAEAMLWIEEVEMVDSVDDLKSSCSVRGIRMPDFEVFNAKIGSALNRIIHNSHFKRRISLEEQKAQKEDRFLRGRQIAHLIWFRRELCRPIYCCSSKWWYSGIRFEIGRNSVINDENPIRWHLGRIVQTKNTRAWETQDRIGIVWPGESSEESRTWLSQIEDDGETGILGPETEIMKEKLWSRIRGLNSVDKEFFEIVGNGKPTGSVLKETIAVFVTILISVQKWHS